MDNTLIIWEALEIAFWVFLVLAVFMSVYLYRLRVVANDYKKLKKLSSQNLKDRIIHFLNKMDSKQLDILLKALYKKNKSD